MTDPTKCGRTTRQTGLPCKRHAGQGTNHVGEGACSLHGAGSKKTPGGGQPHNKNAVTTGEFESLHTSAMSPEEAALYTGVDITARLQYEQGIRLASVREHRILIRIRRAEEHEQTNEGRDLASTTTHNGWNVKGKVDFTVSEHTPTLTRVMALEDALTRVQQLKKSYIVELSRELARNPGDSGGLQAIVDAIDSSARKIAARKENDTRAPDPNDLPDE